MKVLIAFVGLFALVASQCSLEGNTFADTNGNSLTFGTAVGSWVPGLINVAGSSVVNFATWTQQTDVRWGVQLFGTTTDLFCELSGNYNLAWVNDCSGIQFTVVHDYCDDRSALLANAFTLVSPTNGGDCASTGTQIATTLGSSTNFPMLADDAATVVFGVDQYAVVSVAASAAIIQRWRITQGIATTSTVEIVDLGSYPSGFACSAIDVGSYSAVFDSSCASRLCGVADSCQQRAELFQGTGLNGFSGDQCANTLTFVTETEQCSDGRQWNRPVSECLAQSVSGGCMYCKGVAMGEMTAYCLNQQGADCQRVFESAPGRAFCNIAFECPASITSVSLIVIVSSMLALLFF